MWTLFGKSNAVSSFHADAKQGAGSTIGANVFLTTSVPADSIVAQEAANVKIIQKRTGDSIEPDFQL